MSDFEFTRKHMVDKVVLVCHLPEARFTVDSIRHQVVARGCDVFLRQPTALCPSVSKRAETNVDAEFMTHCWARLQEIQGMVTTM